MADRRVKVTFSAEIQNYKASMETAAKSTETLKKKAEETGKATEQAGKKSEDAAKKAAEAAKKHKDAVENVGVAATIGGAAVLAGVGLAIKSYADFDKQMSAVDAATHETAGNMGLLREAAIKAGADTAFSAGEAAQGIEQMAKAGISTKDILGGGLTGALSLAAAGSLDVGKAAEIAASAMTQFKLSGDKLPHVADLLAAGAGKAQGSVEDLGAALNQSGLVAAQTGLTIEETTGGLAAFASAGLVGSDAGTSFKSMLQRLNPQSEEAAKLMEELGLSAYDSQGDFIGLSEYAGELQTALGGMTTEQRNATLSTLFGSDAIRAASVLYENGAAGVEKWENAVNDAGYAAETAARMQDNLAGDLEKLGGAFDTALIQSGSGANEVLRGMVQGLEGVVDAVGKIPAPMLSAVTGVAALAGGAALVGGTLITVIPKIRDTRDALNELAPAGGKARSALDKISKVALPAAALGTFALALAKLAESDYMSKIDTGMGRVSLALVDVAKNSPGAAAGMDSLFKDRDGGNLITGVDDLGDALTRTFNKNRDQEFNDFGEHWINMATGLEGSSHILADSFDRIDQGLADMVSSGKSEDAAKNFDLVAKAAKDRGISIEELTTKFPAYTDALKQAEADGKAAGEGGDAAAAGITAAGDASEDAAVKAEGIAKALEAVGLAADGAVVDVEAFTSSLFRAGLLNLSASDAAIKYEQALQTMEESLAKNGKTMDIHTEKGQANRSAFNALARAAMDSATATATETLATDGSAAAQAILQTKLKQSYLDMLKNAEGMVGAGAEAEALTRKALGIPDNVNIDTWVRDHASGTLDGIKGKADGLNGKVVTIVFQTDASGFYDPSAGTDGKGAGSGSKRKGPGVMATGGKLLGYTDGGKLPSSGPGTEVTDGFLAINSAGRPVAMLDKDEWVINGDSSNRYNRELAAINAGTFPKLPGYANGSQAREYSAQQFGRGSAGSTTVTTPDVYVQNPFTGDYLLARTASVAASVISSADSQSQHMRRGRA